jgi:hypothetical protein
MTRQRETPPRPDDEEGLVRRCERELALAVWSVLEEGPPSTPGPEVESLALALEYLLRVRLPELAGTRRYGSPDGVLVRMLEASSPRLLALDGWVIEVGTQRCEPFAAWVELTDDGTDVRTYRLALGDAEKGLQRLDIDARQVRLGALTVEEWLYVLSREASSPTSP